MDEGTIRNLAAWDRRHVWHPFTQMQDWVAAEPVIIAEGDGVELVDVRGRRYIDGVSSLWTNVHGHRREAIDRAVQDQLGRIAHSTLLGLANVPSIEFARALAAVAPEGLEKVFYSDAGSTAVEVAIKMAFQYFRQSGEAGRGRTRFACLSLAYHGDTIGSVSLGGIDLFHALYKPLLFDTVRIPAPYCYRCPWGLERPGCGLACADEAERIIGAHAGELAAMVMEPLVQGAAGMIVHPEGFLRRVAGACRRHGVFLVLDEVAVGFGRTGRLFACEHEGVAPDFLCLAKGITGGYLPLAATLATERVFEGFLGAPESGRTFYHGHTYTGNPLACAAALASLRLFEEERVLERVARRGEELAGYLSEIAGLPGVGDVRRCGLMAGIELVRDRAAKEPFPPARRVGHRVILEARRRGAILRPLGDVIVLMPPLAIDRDTLARLAEITRDSIAAVIDEEGAA